MNKSLLHRFLLLVLVVLSFQLFGQGIGAKDRLNLKISSPRYDRNFFRFPNLRLDAHYGFSKHFEAGMYLGYAKAVAFANNGLDEDFTSSFEYIEYSVPSFGLSGNYHILPYLIKKEGIRYDWYLIGRFGVVDARAPDERFKTYGLFLTAAAGTGVSVYVGEHWGLFGSYTANKYFTSVRKYKPMMWRAGLSFKF